MAEAEKPAGKILDRKVLRRLLTFIQPYRGRFFFVVFLTLLVGGIAPLKPWLIQKTVDGYILKGDPKGLLFMTLLLAAVTLLHGLISYTHTYLSNWLGQQVIRDIRVQVFEHITALRLSFFDKTPIGRLVTRSVSDVETLAQVFTNGLASIAGDILQLVFILVLMFSTDWKLTLVCLSTLPVLLISTYIFKEKIKEAYKDVRAAVSNLNAFVQEHVTGMAIVQIFNSEEREMEKFQDINKDFLKANIRTVLYYSVYFPVAEIIGAAGTGLLVWYGARAVLHEEVTLGVLIAFIMYISMFFRPIRMLADRFNTLQLGIVSADRLIKLLDSEERIQDSGDFKPKGIEGKIEFENVWFAYSEDDYVLKDISFSVNPGEVVALVGATGAGKSSIVNLIPKFYEIQKGTIRLDGRNIEDYDLAALRQHIGIVLQDVFLFSDTILENITLGDSKISRAEIQAAAEEIGAWEFISQLKEGLDYNVQERGATLSVGQRQLISFVRAMVSNPEVIILDEATSSVDSETEQSIQRAVERLLKGRTAIVIAHRLSTIQQADKIVVMDKGQIVEMGTHQELLKKGGAYATLHEMQYAELSGAES